MRKVKNSRKLHALILLVLVVIIGINRFLAYVDNYYTATDEAWKYIKHPAEGVKVERVDNTILFEPENPVAGFIFYPGGLVETEAYAPFMEELAEQGIFGVIVEMPFYLAMFDANGARGVQAKYPEIKNWYIGGHSLGGAMASLYVDRHDGEYDGFVLLAAYSTKDLSKYDLKVLSVMGSEDGVINMEHYDKYKKNLPDNLKEVVIDGGIHSYFGDYGIQSGDGQPAISVEDQRSEIVEAVVEFIEK